MSNFGLKIFIVALFLPGIIITRNDLSAQSADDQKEIFTHAESFFLYEDYELANQLFLLLDSPDNMNIKYKIGTCYLNIPGEKEKSIPYLETAVKSASYSSKTESYKELRAPLETYFSLAKAYMINNEFEKALNSLQIFRKLAGENGSMTNIDYIEQLIQACKNAIQFRNDPVAFTRDSLGKDMNQGSVNENPAVSFDGNSMVYTERRGLSNAIFYARKEGGIWQAPLDITSQLRAGNDCSSCSMNNDGTEMFLYKTDNYDGAIYSSELVKGSWTPIKILNRNINTKYYESHASVSSDGKRLYFTSNRPGGQGNLDIYVSVKDAGGDWGPAVNLGPEINTPFNEDTPFITANDSVLYFSSEGHNSMGGYDNFKSTGKGSGWEVPVNLGFPINSADDDKFYQPADNGRSAFYSIATDYKKKAIFHLNIKSVEVKPREEQPDSTSVKITENIVAEKIAIPDTVSDKKVIARIISPEKTAEKSSDTSDTKGNTVYDPEYFYTVQVIALYRPVKAAYFRNVPDIKMTYNADDKFHRYTTGRFSTREEADTYRANLMKKGFPEQIFIRKVPVIPENSPGF